jgi:CHASE2 domain-containing sensor protein
LSVDPARTYINLDLWVERGDGDGYRIRGESAHGDSHGSATGDLALLGANDDRLADNTADADYIKALGIRLHQFLFKTAPDAGIQSLLDQCLGAGGQSCGVRIRLQLADLNPEIAAIPWEFLYAESRGGFFASSVRTPVVRFVKGSLDRRDPEARWPLDMLVVIPDVPDLDVDAEKRRINEALEGITPKVKVTFLEGIVTRRDLSDALTREDFDFVHFIGHGDFSEGKGRLRLNLSAVEPDWIDEQALGELVKNHEAIKLIVLNTCRGATASSSRAFAGLAPQLVLAGQVPAVVAMQYPISDEEALAFVQAFYSALFQGSGRGSVDAAITAARSALSRDFPGKRAVGLPVLFTRYNEGVLFKVVVDAAGTVPASLTPEEAEADRVIIRDAERAIETSEHPAQREKQQAILGRARARLRFRNRAVAIAALMFVVVALAAASGLFERVSLTWIAAASPVWFGDPVAKTLPVDSIAIVTTQDVIDSTWRPRHAELLTKLSQAGARVVAFDVRFRSQTPEDATLAAAIQAARQRGTAVIGGANRLQGDSLALAPVLVNQVVTGIDCLGENPLMFSGVVPLLWSRDGREMLPSFALAVVTAWRKANVSPDPEQREVHLTDRRGQVIDRVRLTKMTSLFLSQPKCPIMTRGSHYGEMLAVRAPLGEWRDPKRRYDYAAVLALPPGRLEWARDRIILVGNAVTADLSQRKVGFRTDKRYGVERQADAIATILGNAEPIPVGSAIEYLLVAALAGLGAVLAYRGRRPRRGPALLMVLGVFAGLALLSTILYWGGHRLLNLLYPLLAFVLTFSSLLLLRRRWLP